MPDRDGGTESTMTDLEAAELVAVVVAAGLGLRAAWFVSRHSRILAAVVGLSVAMAAMVAVPPLLMLAIAQVSALLLGVDPVD